ncbi:MAG: RNA methyltransferase [Acidimicrobiales bacterium]|nr:RNA methyltransferase [Acidimicrobiales bacterium]MCB1015099.1 RNA methyltransferase [Acidimicrobiales bacterium]
MLEGPHVVAAALEAGLAVDEVFHEHGADPAVLERARGRAVPVHELEPGTLARISDAVSPQPVLAVAPWCDVALDRIAAEAGERPVVVLHELADPGNVGTLVRTAEAAGAAGVVVSGRAADVFGPKAVRASAGALFHVPVAVAPAVDEVVARLRSAGLRLLGTAADAATPYDREPLTGPLALFLGNEADGLPAPVRAALDRTVAVPIDGRAESLNVAAAGAVLCFEAARQRRSARSNPPGSIPPIS